MKLWKWALAVMVAATIGLVAGCASESKKAREEARIEARAQELAEQIVRKMKAIDTATLVATAGGMTTDKRLVNPPGTVWLKPYNGRIGHVDFPLQFYVFFANGRWVSLDNDKNKENGRWFTKDNKLLVEFKIKSDTGRFRDTTYSGYYSVEVDSMDGYAKGIYLKHEGVLGWLLRCEPNVKGSCHGFCSSIENGELKFEDDCGYNILEMVGGDINAFVNKYK